ncbi:MAG TPA: hypothetical protein VF083_01200 [Acidimicrobiia bacterium]
MSRLASALALILTLAACVTVDTATSTTPPTTAGSTLATTSPEPTATLPSTTTTAPPEPTTTDLPGFPPERESLEHGGDAWVVVLAGSDNVNDPALTEAIQAAEDAGYATGPTDCDEGAEAALGMPDGTLTVSVYFETEADAEAALLAFEARGVTGVVALVQTFCLD